jgi:hypothetical protein
LTSFNAFSFNSSSDPDIDWSVFENAGKISMIFLVCLFFIFQRLDRYLLRDDSVWITRLSEDFWWNLERISEMSHQKYHRTPQVTGTKINHPIAHPMNPPQSMSLNAPTSTRKIVGQRSTMLTPAGSPMATNIPEKNNHFFPNLSSFAADQDVDYNPFQSKISFDNHLWTNSCQQAIPWQ